MSKLYNRARMTITSTGTGTLTLGSAVTQYNTFAAAGVANADVVSYAIEDGVNWEVGTGTYSTTGPTLTRTPSASSNAGAAISVTTSAQVYVTALAADILNPANLGTNVQTALGIAVGTAGSPVVNGGALGTPSGGTLSNCGSLPISGISSLGTGVGNALALAVTGSGNIVCNTSPTLSSPTLGTPAGGTLSNCGGYSVASLANAGAGVLTALGNTTDATGGLITYATFAPVSGKKLTVNNTLTLAGTDATTMTFPGASDTVVGLSATQTLTNKTITAVKETKTAPAISTGTLTLDCSTGNVFSVTLNANVTTLSFTNVPATGTAYALTLSLVANGTAFTVTWGASVKWPGGTAPTLTSTTGKADTFVLTTWDGGTTWYAFTAGQNS